MIVEEITSGKKMEKSPTEKVADLRELVQMAIFTKQDRENKKSFFNQNGDRLVNLYKGIEGDPRCSRILFDSNSSTKDKGIVDQYNQRVRNSDICEELKKALII